MSNVTRTDKIKLLAMLKSAVKGACRKYDVSTWPIAISIDLPTIDLILIEFATEFELDIVTINYVRHPNVAQRVRNLFPMELNLLIISTIYDQQGLDNIDVIIQKSDGIILAHEFLAFQITNKYSMHAIELQIKAKCQKVNVVRKLP
ncbi:unnamed protein product [Colias eurytheme]|nr:unnamed protein product [Colias eurytheme]